jgi:hypothetical protein
MKNKTAWFIIENIIEPQIKLNEVWKKKNQMGNMTPAMMMSIDDILDLYKRIIKDIKKHFK